MIFKKNAVYEVRTLVMTHTSAPQIKISRVTGQALRDYTKSMKFKRSVYCPEQWVRTTKSSITKLWVTEVC